MVEIKTFPFDRKDFDKLRDFHYGLNWPVVYIQENGSEMYIGQTTTLYSRSKQHYDLNENRRRLKRIHVLTDEEFNLSSAFDFESLLIQYVSADGVFKLQNGNGGLINHNYFEKEKYQAKLDVIWPKLQELGLVKEDLHSIKNSEFFKYSPYKALTEDQLEVATALEESIKANKVSTHIVHGNPGTGKSILAMYLLKHLKETSETSHLKIALVVPMTGLRATLQRVVKRVPGLGVEMVIGPSDVVKKEYDLLIVDEAHRLRRRVNLANFGSYDQTNRALGLAKEGTQLDWVMKCSKKQIFFYDKKQNVVPGDVQATDFSKLDAKEFELVSQMRINAGEDYLRFVDNLLEGRHVEQPRFSNYEFKMYDSIRDMVEDIKTKDAEHKLARLVAGYAWSWKTKGNKPGHDIEIDGLQLTWNSTNIDWVNSKNSLNEVGCIHTVQGYDLNYTGVIIGPEFSYDPIAKRIIIDEKKYKDINGKRSISDPEELKGYITNIYKTLLTRGIKGTFVYVVDEELRKYFSSMFSDKQAVLSDNEYQPIKSPITVAMVQVPIVGSAPCGSPLLGEENIEDEIMVPKSKLRAGATYFILRANGDSMDLAGINDGDLVLCRFAEKGETGDRVVALLGDNVTIKMYDKKDGRRILLPKSTNKSHQPIIPEEGDSVQGIVQEVLE
ncbi:MAG: hypothetical protein JWO50_739 [Candidatus Kaiserbacteria bacterium]|nr:hypothetical protein [Candidatus Kaiserbacteria bacterium]